MNYKPDDNVQRMQAKKPDTYIQDSDLNPHISWGYQGITQNKVLAIAAIGLLIAGVGLSGCTRTLTTNQTLANQKSHESTLMNIPSNMPK